MPHVLVVGAGAWGTALAALCARGGHRVSLWARDAGAWAARRESPRLPGVALPDGVEVTAVLPRAADAVLVAVPVQALRPVLGMALPLTLPGAPLVLCMKGLEAGTALLPAEVAAVVRPGAAVAVLSGPNFAHEVARGLPAAAVLAAGDAGVRARTVALLGQRSFRMYGSADLAGVQVCGAAKNVVAIAAGVAAGAGLGENARAALVARSLAEIGRLAVLLGGEVRTASGLAGLGDLVLTCTGAASRNYRLGVLIGGGMAPGAARAAIGAAVEGMDAAPALLARSGGRVACPVVVAVTRLLRGETDVAGAVAELLDRDAAAEE